MAVITGGTGNDTLTGGVDADSISGIIKCLYSQLKIVKFSPVQPFLKLPLINPLQLGVG